MGQASRASRPLYIQMRSHLASRLQLITQYCKLLKISEGIIMVRAGTPKGLGCIALYHSHAWPSM